MATTTLVSQYSAPANGPHRTINNSLVLLEVGIVLSVLGLLFDDLLRFICPADHAPGQYLYGYISHRAGAYVPV